jgi:hypothetical protein
MFQTLEGRNNDTKFSRSARQKSAPDSGLLRTKSASGMTM